MAAACYCDPEDTGSIASASAKVFDSESLRRELAGKASNAYAYLIGTA